MTYKTKEERAAYAREWRAKNPERSREIDASKRAKQPAGSAAERTRRWRAANPERAKALSAANNLKWTSENREGRRAYARTYRDKNRDRLRLRWKVWAAADRAANPTKHREQHLVRFYGITQVQYDEMAATQNFQCKCCGKAAAEEKYGKLSVDHCHKTGKVRGLLCSKCNMIIGQSNDDPSLIRRWADYLSS